MGIPGWVVITETGSVFHSDTGEVPPEYPNAKVITVAEFVSDMAEHMRPFARKSPPANSSVTEPSDG